MAIEARRSAAELAAAINPTLKKCIGCCAHWRMPRPILIAETGANTEAEALAELTKHPCASR
jgi:hypothetical protein